MTRFRCACCGYVLPKTYESHERDGRCYMCEPLTDEERLVMEQEYSTRLRRARMWQARRVAR